MIIWIFSPTEPTPLILTDKASHMVTASILLDSHLTSRTLWNSLLWSPVCKLIIHLILTSLSFMPWLWACEAELMSTFTSHKRLLIWSLHKESTVRSWTPFCVGVNIYPYIEHESLILCIEFWIDNRFDIWILKLLVTSLLSTIDLSNLSFINFERQIIIDTSFAEGIGTYESETFTIWIFTITDQTTKIAWLFLKVLFLFELNNNRSRRLFKWIHQSQTSHSDHLALNF